MYKRQAFDTSRKSAAEAIQSGLIFVNGLERWKADSLVQVGDRLVWRGKGKVILQQIGEKTRKGRFPIVMQKYGS